MYSLHQNNSVKILFSTFLLADPEVFLMCCTTLSDAALQQCKCLLYVTGEGDFIEGRTGGSDWWC